MEEQLTDEQAGLQRDRSTVLQILALKADSRDSEKIR
jgi:hypothetical protein